jgi:hypothetical protein
MTFAAMPLLPAYPTRPYTNPLVLESYEASRVANLREHGEALNLRFGFSIAGLFMRLSTSAPT